LAAKFIIFVNPCQVKILNNFNKILLCKLIFFMFRCWTDSPLFSVLWKMRSISDIEVSGVELIRESLKLGCELSNMLFTRVWHGAYLPVKRLLNFKTYLTLFDYSFFLILCHLDLTERFLKLLQVFLNLFNLHFPRYKI